jgi:hypothetical protein
VFGKKRMWSAIYRETMIQELSNYTHPFACVPLFSSFFWFFSFSLPSLPFFLHLQEGGFGQPEPVHWPEEVATSGIIGAFALL